MSLPHTPKSALRTTAADLFGVACGAADPVVAMDRALCETPLPRLDPDGVYRVIAIGKAAVPMMRELLAHLGQVPCTAIVVTNYENDAVVPGARVMVAGHPVPDENGARAAMTVEALLARATRNDQVIALISGGGSALLPAPLPGISLDDKARVSRHLLAAGLDITQMNLVRQSLSRLKGGGLLQAAAPAPVTAYILSDVIGDDLRVIASGLTVSPIGTRTEAADLLRATGIWPQLSTSVQAVLTAPQPRYLPITASNILIGSNRKSLDAVIAVAGPSARLVDDRLTGDVGAAASRIIEAARKAEGDVGCLVFGGETTVTLRGTGLGGRNQELALRVAMQMPALGRDWAFLSGGTDGRDGPTEAAGGLVDGRTLAKLHQSGGNPDALLANNDSHQALRLTGDLLITGATGTNVADVQILLLGRVSED